MTTEVKLSTLRGPAAVWAPRGMVPSVLLAVVGLALQSARNGEAQSARGEPSRGGDRYRITPFSNSEGLPHSILYSILVDSRGFLWAGTRDGLIRYNGYSIQHFRDQLPSLTTLAEDREGNIWGGTPQGLYRFDRKLRTFTAYEPDRDDPTSLSSQNVYSLLTDRDGTLWVGTDNGLCRFDPARNAFDRFLVHSSDRRRVMILFEDDRGRLWACTAIGGNNDRQLEIYRRDPGSDVFAPVGSIPDSLRTAYARPTWMYRDKQGLLNLVVLAWHYPQRMKGAKSIRWDQTNARFVDVVDVSMETPRDEGMYSNSQTAEKGWIATIGSDRTDLVRGNRGLYLVRNESRPGHPDTVRIVYPPVEHTWAHGIIADQGGLFWSCSHDGLFKMTPTEFLFPPGIAIPTPSSSIASLSRIRALLRDRRGRLWVGTDHQLLRYDVDEGRGVDVTTGVRHRNEFPYGAANVLLEETAAILVGTNFGLLRYDIDRDCLIPNQFPQLINHSVWSVCRDSVGNLWVGTRNDLWIFDRNDSLKRRHRLGSPDRYLSQSVWSLICDGRGDVWAGTQNALYRWSSTDAEPRIYRASGVPEGLPTGAIWSLSIDHAQRLWVGVYGGGLVRYREQSDDFLRPPSTLQLASQAICAILEDDNHNLWLSTSSGLACYYPEDERIISYSDADGLAGNEFALKAAWRDSNGTLYFGGVNHIARFDPALLQTNRRPPSLVITSFRTGDSLIAFELLDNDTVRLEHWQNHITIEFAALDYLNPSANRYAHKLEGVDREWNYTANRRYAAYSNLSPGTYAFHVAGSNNHGVWNRDGMRITIIIREPFWSTLWFRSAVIAILLAAGAAIFAAQRSRARERYERRVIEAKLQALRLQMKPHFLFNSLNSIHSFILHSKTDEAEDYLARFAGLMRAALYHSEHSTITLDREIDFLRSYLELESLRYSERFSWKIDVDSRLDTEQLSIPSMLVQPYVENAIHHGLRSLPAGRLTVTFRQRPDDSLLCTIEDNGIGRAAASARRTDPAHRSIGTSVTRQRLELLNAIHERAFRVEIHDLRNEQGDAGGTRVVLHIPLLNTNRLDR